MCQINASKRRLFLNSKSPLEIYMTSPRLSDTSIPQLGLLDKQLIFYLEWKNHTLYGSPTLFNLNTAASFFQQRNLLGEYDLWINPCIFSVVAFIVTVRIVIHFVNNPGRDCIFQQPHRPVNMFLHHCHTCTAKGENSGSKENKIFFHIFIWVTAQVDDLEQRDNIHIYKIFWRTLRNF